MVGLSSVGVIGGVEGYWLDASENSRALVDALGGMGGGESAHGEYSGGKGFFPEASPSLRGCQYASHVLSQAACKAEPRDWGIHGGGDGSLVISSSLREDDPVSLSVGSTEGT